MTLNPNSNPWKTEREGLDVKALLLDLEDRRKLIKEQAFHEGSWDAVFDEACAMGPLIRRLMVDVSQWYCRVIAVIEAANEE